jgi:alpha-tubulin suppressor-like RCC1 family protein
MDVNHSCLLTVNNGVKCWGADDAGQVGDGANATPRLTPVDVAGLSGGVAQIAASGSQSCALIVGNSVVCWGDFKFVPAPQNGLAADVAAIAGGGSHFCAIINSTSFPGAARCWGRGPLGDGTQNDSSIPVQVSGLTSGVVAIAAYKNGIGNSASCALLSNGSVWCWGENSRGQLGDGTTTDRLTPVLVSGLSSGVTAISAGSNHACALLQSGGVRCWGDNDDGQLGDGTFTDRPTPVDVVGLSSGVVAISAGGDFSDGHTCARLATGALQCWGSNHDGQLGIGGSQFTAQSTPVDVIGLPGAASVVEAGPRHTCAIVSGRVKCWGDNFDGQLGDGTGGYYTTPVPVGVTRKIIPVQGGDLVAPSVTVIIPSGAFTDTVVLTHTLVVDYPAAPNIVLPPAFDIVPGFISGAPAQLEPGKTFTLIATYSEQDLTGLPESGLALYFWNGSQWMKETTSVVDASANTVTATPDHFSIWAVMAEANQSQLRVYLPLIRR